MTTHLGRRPFLGFALLAPLSLAPSSATAQSLYIGDYNAAQVVRYDIQTGAAQGPFTSGYAFSFPQGLAFGADGSLYTGDADLYEIAAFDASTGVYQRTVNAFDGGLGLVVGRDGILYEVDSFAVGHFDENGHFIVDDPYRGHLIGIDPQTGLYVSDYQGPVGGTFVDLCIGPDHNFYVTDNDMRQVYSFDGAAGAPRGAFTSGGDLHDPFGLAFGPHGDLYVTSRENHQILRYSGTTGAFLDVFASGDGLGFPNWVLFGPDGNLYVADFGANQISRFNGATGAYDVFASGVAGPLAFAPSVPPPCPADFNRSGAVDSQDFFDFLAAFFAHTPAADFNHDGTVNSQDFFDFLAAFFTGCP